MAVLVKRIGALIKRSEGFSKNKNDRLGIYIDNDAFIAYMNGKPLELTLKEFELLSYLKENFGRVLTREQLLNAI